MPRWMKFRRFSVRSWRSIRLLRDSRLLPSFLRLRLACWLKRSTRIQAERQSYICVMGLRNGEKVVLIDIASVKIIRDKKIIVSAFKKLIHSPPIWINNWQVACFRTYLPLLKHRFIKVYIMNGHPWTNDSLRRTLKEQLAFYRTEPDAIKSETNVPLFP